MGNFFVYFYELIINFDKVYDIIKLCVYRAESSHSQLKRQLGSSQGNFLTSLTKIHGLLQLKHNETKAVEIYTLKLVICK